MVTLSSPRPAGLAAAIHKLETAGRVVLDVYEVVDAKLSRRFRAASALLARRAGVPARVKRLYHGTSVAAAASIVRDGFKIPTRGSFAFGRGVNLTPDPVHTLMYARARTNACLVVCDVAIARWHANTSRQVQGSDDSVPDYMAPRRGHDAMYGARGMIVVVPSAARVLPRWVITHSDIRR